LGVGCCLVLLAAAGDAVSGISSAQKIRAARPITWADVGPLHKQLESRGITSDAFASHLDRIARTNAQRIREGDLDHLVFYMLQATRFTKLPRIEPALSAKGLVESLDAVERETFLRQGQLPLARVPAPVQSRATALMTGLDVQPRDGRLTYFRELVEAAFPRKEERRVALLREYLRVMRFVYEKEFVAQRSADAADAVRALYRSRGLSTDTAVEAGYLVSLGLGVVKALHPAHRIHRVLIVGPGLDLAPRTALHEEAPPQSYQPWAVIDALLGLDLSQTDDLQVVAADVNPRVVEHLRRARTESRSLTLVSELRDTGTVTLSPEYRAYFTRLGRALGKSDPAAETGGGKGHLKKTVAIHASVASTLDAQQLDIVLERLDGPPFDLVIATNILPYFDDVSLMLALSNVAAMLAPGGVFLHNEGRPFVGEITASLDLPFEQSRHATIATVHGAAPLGDSVWIHRKIGHR
jgi:hypothetical protein